MKEFTIIGHGRGRRRRTRISSFSSLRLQRKCAAYNRERNDTDVHGVGCGCRPGTRARASLMIFTTAVLKETFFDHANVDKIFPETRKRRKRKS